MDEYWIIKPSILITKWYEVFPKKNMSRNQIINSLFRFSLILIIVFISLKSNISWYVIPLFVMFISIFTGGEDIKIKESNCRKSNLTNPYMNQMLYSDNKKACKHNKKEIENNYDFNLYKNAYDFFDKYSLERQFYTMPSTTIAPDFTKFSKWLYNSSSCKYDRERCLLYEDERYH